MNRRMILAVALAAFWSSAALPPLPADALTIAQVDPSSLLLSQSVDLFLSIKGAAGEIVEATAADLFNVSESSDGEVFHPVRVVDVKAGVNRVDGLTFLLLIDNSGSMYDTVGGETTTDVQAMRITRAAEAVRAFLAAVTNPRDAVGIAAFNTDYTVLTQPTVERGELAALLDRIVRPAKEQAYTELYASLLAGVQEMSAPGGRKVLIVLSDGENFPFLQYEKRPHPEYGERVFSYTEPIEAAQREGVSIFGIGFGARKDPNLEAIAAETGGAVYDAPDGEQLRRVYLAIREQVLQEVRLTYRPTMAPAEKKWVRVEYRGGAGALTATRFYYSSILFGLPMDPLSPVLLLPFLLALLAAALLAILKLDHRSRVPNLEVLSAGPGIPATRMVELGQRTVIGSSPTAQMTIAGSPAVKTTHATVVYDQKKRAYTLVADGDVEVNHRPVGKTRILEAGDVIDVGGTTLVFDDDVEKGKKK